MNDVDISLIIACYNETAVLADSIQQVVDVMNQTCYSYEIIFVEDCSTDHTRDLIPRVIEQYPNNTMHVIYHEHNMGRGRTVADGIRQANGRTVGFFDIDLETPAHYIPAHLLAIEQGADMTIAKRVYKVNIWLIHRWILSRGYHFLATKILKTPLFDTEAGFKFFRRNAILPIIDQTLDEQWFWDTEIVTRSFHAGLSLTEIPSLFIKRREVASTVRIFHDTMVYLKALYHFRPVVRQIANARKHES